MYKRDIKYIAILIAYLFAILSVSAEDKTSALSYAIITAFCMFVFIVLYRLQILKRL